MMIVRYNIDYDTDPEDLSSDAFLVTLRDSVGTPLASNPLANNGYGNKMIALYLTPTQAATITWGGTYSIRVQGNPSLFPIYPYEDRSFTFADWVSSTTLTQGQTYFTTAIIQQTKVLETLLGVTYTVSTQTGYRLNNDGQAYWNEMIPGISLIPGITSIGSSQVVFDNATYTYPTKVASDLALSPAMKANFTNIMDVFGIPWYAAGIALLILVFMTVAGAVYQVSGGNTKLSTVAALPAGFVVAFLFSSVLVWIVFGVFMMVAVVIFSRFM
jgi:hypothetical protein